MKSKDRQLLLIDLCGRLPYEVKGLHRGETQRLLIMDSFGSYQVNGYDAWFDLNSVIFKPYLRPMSSMTDKEKKDLLNYVVGKGSKYFEVCDDVSITDKSSDVQDLKSFELKWINFNPNTTSRYIEWLLKKHFDFCDLIPKNLALSAPEGMYKI